LLEICAARGFAAASYEHPLRGPDGAALYTDAVLIGPTDASNVLVIVSGTHGVEGYAGSLCQACWLNTFDQSSLGTGTAVLLIHMLNPWGAAWRRRHNEDNVDLNRSFIDRLIQPPVNEAHDELVARGVMDTLDDPDPDRAWAALTDYRRTAGEEAFSAAVFRGQYTSPNGFNYGGRTETWSQTSLTTILTTLLNQPKNIALVDLHTGLGSFGYGTAICLEPPGSDLITVLRSWYSAGFVALLVDRGGLPYELQGDLSNGVKRVLPLAQVLAISLEFGTYDAERFARLMVSDEWVRRQGAAASSQGEAIRAELLHFFCPDSPLWREMIVERAFEVFGLALEGLAQRR
jgi:predicted deacylase